MVGQLANGCGWVGRGVSLLRHTARMPEQPKCRRKHVTVRIKRFGLRQQGGDPCRSQRRWKQA
eukprot:2664879-Amphidinium_carterae.1